MLETSVSYTKPILIKIDKYIVDLLDHNTIQLPVAIQFRLQATSCSRYKIRCAIHVPHLQAYSYKYLSTGI